MTSIFLASWEICLNKFISILNSLCTFPRLVLCPRNPCLFGNEWYTACCALSGILLFVKVVEGKAHTRKAGPLECADLDENNLGLLLRMMKRYFATGTYIIIDSCLYLLKVLIWLSNKGVFACADTTKKKTGLPWYQV